jgi:hypothetical protein
VRINYTTFNRGSVPITSWKATYGFEGGQIATWDRADRIAVGANMSFGSVMYLNGLTMPRNFTIKIVAVNGSPDAVATNNTSTILVTK